MSLSCDLKHCCGHFGSPHVLYPSTPWAPQALYYLLFTNPNPLFNIWDFYVGAPLTDGANSRWSSDNFQLRDKLGGGNFGITFEGLRLQVGWGFVCLGVARWEGTWNRC